MTQQSVCRHVAHDRTHYPVSEATSFGLTAKSCVLSGESGNTIFIVFGLTQPMLESIIYHTRGEHTDHYTIHKPTNQLTNRVGLLQCKLHHHLIEMLLVLATAYLNFFSLGVKHIDCMYRFVLYHYRSIALPKYFMVF
jgi:hypothetical protein